MTVISGKPVGLQTAPLAAMATPHADGAESFQTEGISVQIGLPSSGGKIDRDFREDDSGLFNIEPRRSDIFFGKLSLMKQDAGDWIRDGGVIRAVAHLNTYGSAYLFSLLGLADVGSLMFYGVGNLLQMNTYDENTWGPFFKTAIWGDRLNRSQIIQTLRNFLTKFEGTDFSELTIMFSTVLRKHNISISDLGAGYLKRGNAEVLYCLMKKFPSEKNISLNNLAWKSREKFLNMQ